ncbi:MAG: divalent-cation tolerance protein CutA [Bradyrhizobiaceae bacterium]|nr:MAG: divalent-cation tolerance protein CutA [Bradyrhizobiaceae bacterium]
MSGACIVMTTVSGEQQAKAIATAVIEARLAACAQTMPIASCYWWDGKVVDDAELLILFKTAADKYPALETKILELHPYDTPEIIRLPVDGGFGKYLAWIEKETR